MKYLVLPKNQKPFLTNWFDWENNYTEGMIIINNELYTFSTDGKNWEEIEIDIL